ncbi:MAG: hypothetical protein Q7S00_03840, partial [bacterium]|nr:hypothetical protein [bacterium]
MKTTNTKFFTFCLLLLVSACSWNAHNGRKDQVIFHFPPDGSTSAPPVSAGGPEDFNPFGNDTPLESPEETADEVPEDTTACQFSVNQSVIDFGLNQLGERECTTLTIPACVTGNAEIDDSSSSGEEGPAFVLLSGESESASLALAGGVTVCYKRGADGNHTGRVNIIGTAGSIQIAHAISLSGQTSPVLFSNLRPHDGDLVWEHSSDFVSTPVAGGFSIPASGTVENELESLFSTHEVTISSGGHSANFPIG